MKITINTDACIGCGLCSNICPEVFVLDQKTSKAAVIPNVDYNSYAQKIEDAKSSCPVSGIVTE